jgi:hypothetical protein
LVYEINKNWSITMTTKKTTMALAELAEKGADGDLLRETIQFVAQRLMGMDVESLCAGAYGERTSERCFACVARRADHMLQLRYYVPAAAGRLRVARTGARGGSEPWLLEPASMRPIAGGW